MTHPLYDKHGEWCAIQNQEETDNMTINQSYRSSPLLKFHLSGMSCNPNKPSIYALYNVYSETKTFFIIEVLFESVFCFALFSVVNIIDLFSLAVCQMANG